MDEDSLRAVLTQIAADPEPPACIDVDAARRRGRRRLLGRRAAQVTAAPLTVALAVGVIVTVPHALFARTQRAVSSAPAKSSAPTTAEPATAPASFNPLVPYAGFGWLPSGFSEGAVSPLWTSPFHSGTASLTLGAQDPSGHTLLLTVNARGACPPETPYPGSSLPGCVTERGAPGASRAPDVNGRPAWYAQWGSSISWEYAPDAWATLDADTAGQAQGKVARTPSYGWVLTPASGALASARQKGLAGPPAGDVAAAIKAGKLIAPSAQTKAMLRRIATSVRYGQETAVAFPFRLSGLMPSGGALPAGWQLSSVSFWPSGKRLEGRGISAGPAADTSALSVSAGPPDGYSCNFVAGQSSYVKKYGVSWIDRVIGEANKDDEVLCSTGAAPAGRVDGLQVFIYLEASSSSSGSLLPGASSLEGVFGVYSRMRFLGSDPSGWTTDPLG